MRGLLRLLILSGLAAFWAASPVRADDTPAFTHTPDVIYGRKAGLALTMDVFAPKEHANGLGLLFVISGGWMSHNRSIQSASYEEFLRRGYTVFAVVHGSMPKFTIPETADDVQRAVRFVRYHAKDYHIDPDRLGISGASSGGQLSLLQGMAGDKGDPQARDPIDRVSSRVQAVACFFPPTDLLNWGEPGRLLDVGHLKPPFTAAVDFKEYDHAKGVFVSIADEERVRDILRRVSPLTHVRAGAPPTLLIHGDRDLLVPLQQSEIMVAKLKEAGVPAELIVKKGGGHGWPGLLHDATWVADWFDRYLKDKAKAGP
jgi:acetyl esterase/lipase